MTEPLPPHKGRKATLDILHLPCATHRVESFTAAAAPNLPGGAPYRLFRAVPHAGRGPHPVLYMLDGIAAFDFLTVDLLAQVPDLAVIGIGYATEQQFARAERVFDYTPTPDGQSWPDPHHEGRIAGGGPGFIARLIGALRQEAEARIQVDPARRMLWGHSLGGLCALQVMAQVPGAFARYAAISPSIWWSEALAQEMIARVTLAPGTPVLMAMGDSEKRTGSGETPAGPPPLTLAAARQLRARPGVDLRLQIYPGAVHIATLPASLPAALSLAAAP